MRKFLGVLLTVIGLFFTMVLIVLSAVEIVGTDAELYYKLQVRYGVLNTAGISQENLKTVDEALAECLKGDADALDALESIPVDGVEREAFHAHEKTHMDDCRHLFDLLRTVKRCSYMAVPLLVLGMFLLRNAKAFRRVECVSLALLLIPLGAFIIWAAADFNSAFTFFHRMLFTNNLWLLNPETDLLIRICPEEMFMQMGIRIAALFAVAMLVILFAANRLNRRISALG